MKTVYSAPCFENMATKEKNPKGFKKKKKNLKQKKRPSSQTSGYGDGRGGGNEVMQISKIQAIAGRIMTFTGKDDHVCTRGTLVGRDNVNVS